MTYVSSITYIKMRTITKTSETYKILHNMFDTNCNNSLFELKESNTRGYNFAVKRKLSRTSIRQNIFS